MSLILSLFCLDGKKINSNIKVGPEIFVQLKKGSLYDNYQKKEVLGEGNKI